MPKSVAKREQASTDTQRLAAIHNVSKIRYGSTDRFRRFKRAGIAPAVVTIARVSSDGAFENNDLIFTILS